MSQDFGISLFAACPIGFYGYGCSLSCGNCAFGGPCSIVDGVCPSGCDDGWTGATCHEGNLQSSLVISISVISKRKSSPCFNIEI